MRKLALQMGMSLDGLVALPGRHGAGGWGLPPEDPALKQRKLDWLQDAGLHLMGRITYEEMAEFWPVSGDDYAAPMTTSPRSSSPRRSNARTGRRAGSRAVTSPRRSPSSSSSPART
jgi:dihydrofolate reductase